jgi:hypothetical protein
MHGIPPGFKGNIAAMNYPNLAKIQAGIWEEMKFLEKFRL